MGRRLGAGSWFAYDFRLPWDTTWTGLATSAGAGLVVIDDRPGTGYIVSAAPEPEPVKKRKANWPDSWLDPDSWLLPDPGSELPRVATGQEVEAWRDFLSPEPAKKRKRRRGTA